MQEEWRKIEGAERYEVSNCGHVRKRMGANLYKPVRVSQRKDRYCVVGITYDDGHRHQELIHRLMGEAFLSRHPRQWVCKHKDENPAHNVITNIYWLTTKKKYQ